ncbi:MAG: VanZ family protein [Clostridia bacterium]|nr:VanZ family protein [Clostridia bacterium]
MEKKKHSVRHALAVLLAWATAALCAAAIFLFSSQNGADSAELSGSVMLPFVRVLYELFGDASHNVFRKFAHFFIFAALMFFVYHAFFRTRRRRRLSPGLPFLLCVLYAVSDEVHQLFVPERACRLFDVGVDALGCVLGGLCFYLLAMLCIHISGKSKSRRTLS